MARQDIKEVRKEGNEARAQDNFIELYTTVTTNTADIAAASASAHNAASAAAAASAAITSLTADVASVNTVAHAASAAAASASAAAAAASAAITALPAASLVKITTATANNSATTLEITSGIDSTYRGYVFDLENVLHATDNATFLFQVYANGSYQTGTYLSSGVESTGASTGVISSTAGVNMCSANGASNTAAGGGWTGRIILFNPSQTTSYKVVTVHGGYTKQGNTIMEAITATGYYKGGTQAVTQVRIISSSGNIASGSMTMYGLK